LIFACSKQKENKEQIFTLAGDGDEQWTVVTNGEMIGDDDEHWRWLGDWWWRWSATNSELCVEILWRESVKEMERWCCVEGVNLVPHLLLLKKHINFIFLIILILTNSSLWSFMPRHHVESAFLLI
jgi:hypothetical protein